MDNNEQLKVGMPPTEPILNDEDMKAWGKYVESDMGIDLWKTRALAAEKRPVWVKDEYERLFEQLKAEPERKIVCWVNYQWRVTGEKGDILRDICSIMGKVMGFNARGIGYGGTETMNGLEGEKQEFLEECERLNVEWLDEYGCNE